MPATMGEIPGEREDLFLRVPPELKRALEERARAEGRSMNAQAIYELRQLAAGVVIPAGAS